MASDSQPVRHHHTPVFYLRPWCDASGMLSVTRRSEAGPVSFRASPRGVGLQSNLWAFSNPPDGDRQKIEREFFGPLDGAASLVAAKLLASETTLGAAEREAWARFVSSLHVRVPERVHRLRREVPGMLTDLLSAPNDAFDQIKGDHPALTPAEFTEMEFPHAIQDAGISLLPRILTEGRSVETIARMQWSVRSFPCGGHSLLTSDAPVLLLAPLDDPACLIVLPLSPRHLFFASRQSETHRRLMAERAWEVVRSANETVVANAPSFVVGDCAPAYLAKRWRHAGSGRADASR